MSDIINGLFELVGAYMTVSGNVAWVIQAWRLQHGKK